MKKSEVRHHNYSADVEPLIRQFKSAFNISQYNCSAEKYPKITIVDRENERRMDNAKDVLSALLKG